METELMAINSAVMGRLKLGQTHKCSALCILSLFPIEWFRKDYIHNHTPKITSNLPLLFDSSLVRHHQLSLQALLSSPSPSFKHKFWWSKLETNQQWRTMMFVLCFLDDFLIFGREMKKNRESTFSLGLFALVCFGENCGGGVVKEMEREWIWVRG